MTIQVKIENVDQPPSDSALVVIDTYDHTRTVIEAGENALLWIHSAKDLVISETPSEKSGDDS